jgi:preprotein translocase subunit SecA
MHYLQASLKAHGVFRKDIDYVVKASSEEEGPEIIIVDENTGRLMFGRRYSDGLHQAIEAKEHVKVKNESQTLATITFQNYFRLYSKLAGMTGTAKTEEDEFRKIYALDVVQVPTNKPIQRRDNPDVIYKNEEHKLRGIAAEILRIYCKQQPVLVGTRSIEMSERVSARLAPSPLATLCMVEVLRNKMETTKGVTAEKKKEYTNLFNQPMSKLSVTRLKNVAKDLDLTEDPLTPVNMNEIARIFEVSEQGLDHLEEALTHGIGHNILNAKYHEKEALIIAEAGRKGAVTIATNMAGRGVDILLGGKHIKQELPPVDGSLKSLNRAETVVEQSEAPQSFSGMEEEPSHRRFGKSAVLDAVTIGALTDEEHKQAADVVRSLGGLFILGTERHESRRIDNQLRGRAGRQGDPGESRFFVSLEDELWRLFGDRTSSPLFKAWEDHLAMDAKLLSKAVERAQKKIEEHYFESRKHVLNYDDVMNRQRELIYQERRRILQGVDLKETILHYIRENIEAAVKAYTPHDVTQAEWDLDTLYNELNDYFMLFPALTVEELKGKSREEMVHTLTDHVLNVYNAREQEMEEMQGEGAMRQLERWMALRAINDNWMEHLANMDYLREGIGLRGYEQKDPLLIYQKEAFDEFERMQQAIQDDIVRNLFRMQVVVEPPPLPMMPIQQNLPPNVAPAIPLPADLPKPNTPKFAAITDLAALETPRNVITNRDPEPANPKAGSNGNGRRSDGAPADWKGGRNDPCWCGSGQKYKKCHGK